MKQKILENIDEFVRLCNTAFNISAANFAKENFPKLINNFWDESKTDDENLNTIKNVFESNKNLNVCIGNTAAANVIGAFQEGWLNKL